MFTIILFILAILFTIAHLQIKRNHRGSYIAETFLAYLLFFNVGVMGILGFAGHIFRADEIAASIGWPSGSPFQFEVGMANLAFGVLGILCLWLRKGFWGPVVLGSSIFFLGCFIGHLIQYSRGDIAPYNIGVFIWLQDLILPILNLILLALYLKGGPSRGRGR